MSQERNKAEAEASAAMQDAREALARESDIQGQLQKADQVMIVALVPFKGFCRSRSCA